MAKPQVKIDFPRFYWVLGADFSLRRPGFFKVEIKDSEIIPETCWATSVDNKTAKSKSHGQILTEITEQLQCFAPGKGESCPLFCVREKAFNSRGAMSEIGIFEVVGVANMWAYDRGCEWHEIYPVTVKKLLTDNGKADKTQVLNAVKKVFPHIDFKNDDESDAAGVALAFLIQNGQLANFTEKENVND